ncbi:proline-rich protein PRCC [Thrips palmi]|uniref:Proline-rich protein PRCC n=1 Tax=Thrips palmi TaxID=161013 RepID=A0A6P8YJA4_THRPL|nr:proline-rich protein PRCC [Thrips palmi]XP_034239923.1 proline-rich protein PRCC [Thrips palmi]
MMSLVAYGSSGESENESDNEVEPTASPKQGSSPQLTVQVTSGPVPVVSSDETLVLPSGSKQGLHTKLPPPKTAVREGIEDEDSSESLGLGSKLPAPKTLTTPSLLESSIVASRGKNKKGTVKIMIPSLSDFPEDEDEPKPRKKIQPSEKGSGLFALLPPPKQAPPIKQANRSLVPNVLTRKPTPAPTPVRKPKPSAQSAKRKHQDSDPESDGDGEGIDFFSLNKEDKLPDIPIAEVPLLPTVTEYESYGVSEVPAFPDPSSSHQLTDYQYQQYPEPESTAAIPQADSGQDFINFNGGEDLPLDDEALKKLCGRKGRNREEIQILDVSGDSIMPDQREWLTKQLTEEQPRPSSKSKLFGPSSQQKRKHQITYLAHVAKENELELKNQWANNRQTRKQTQSKYGF